MFTATERVSITRARWLKAQEHEAAFWRRVGNEIAEGTGDRLDWYRWRAGELESWLVPDAKMKAGRVLEIGSGPIGIVSFLEWGDRYAIDPLEPFYGRQPGLIELRSSDVVYLAGSGEQLPLAERAVALVIVDNVIDHTYSPGRILQEIWRVLQLDGTLYVCVNVHTRWGAALHRLLAAVRIDKRHPYTFTNRTLASLLATYGFKIVRERAEDYEQAKASNRRSPRITDRIKSWTGLSEFRYQVLCRKRQ